MCALCGLRPRMCSCVCVCGWWCVWRVLCVRACHSCMRARVAVCVRTRGLCLRVCVCGGWGACVCVVRVACVHVRVCLRARFWWRGRGACVCAPRMRACVCACGHTVVVRVCLWVVGGVRVCVWCGWRAGMCACGCVCRRRAPCFAPAFALVFAEHHGACDREEKSACFRSRVSPKSCRGPARHKHNWKARRHASRELARAHGFAAMQRVKGKHRA